jgi:drug/metabolite transporter (DMT)-like permease
MSSITQNKHFLLFGIVISMLIWGISWPSAKVLSHYGQPHEIAFIRFIFTFVGVFVLLKSIRQKIFISRKGIPSLLMASVLMAGYSLLFFNGIKNGMPGAGGVLVTTTTPLVTFLLAVFLSKRTLTSKEIIGLCIGLLAGCFLLSIWNRYDKIFDSGNIFFLGSTVVWAFLSRHTSSSSSFGSPLSFSLWIYFCCIFILLFFVNPTSILTILKNGDPTFWFNMIFNAVINTGMATTFYFYGTSKLGPERTSSFIYIVPFAAALSSLLFIHEIIHWNTIVGGILGILSVWIINKKTKPIEHQSR